ncbi:MAG TPA: NPCBM/NEW2 domain-containing protein [Thermoguttaceae bacterium]|nr:NPCBM/NEW2 domain-containing protein [Thermoguttaceae bacterium]
MSRLSGRMVLAVLLVLTVPLPGWCAGRAGDMVREDWYFRESLAAIRDWEAVLARWEEATPEPQRTPVLPVPAGGEAVAWPNPIPRTLLPAEDRSLRVRVSMVDGKVKIDRGASDSPSQPQTVAPGETVLGYKHPGGGGKDQWYHRYERRFDRLTTFQAKPARFALGIDAPLDLRRGGNELAVTFSNATQEPLALTATLHLHLPEGTRACGQQAIELAPGATRRVTFSVPLDDQGGGLLILAIADRDESYWLPLLTHVEDVESVLASIEQILGDAPDKAAAARFRRVRATHQSFRQPEKRCVSRTLQSSETAGAWRDLFEEASRLRDDLLLRRIDFDALVFVKRKPYFSEQPFMDAHHLFNRPGGGVYRLSPVSPHGAVTPVVDGLGEGVYRDVFLHWDAEKFLFAFGNGSDQWDGSQSYHIYEAGVDGTGLRQLTTGPKNDCEPLYLPGGRIGFTSDRSEHYVMCGGNRHSPTLFVMDGDGSDVEQLSFNMFNDFNPTMLPDGRILYSRWEYNERSVTALHNPFTINPDGTMMSPYYGNATIRPNVIMFPRPVPESRKVMALFTAHHGQTHGTIGLIDVRRGIDGPEPLTVLTPNVPVTGEKALDSRFGWYSDPAPLGETTYLCSFTPTVLPWLERSWALYVGDRHGNLALVVRDPDISCAEPVPLVRRPRPCERPAATTPSVDRGQDAEATLLLADVYVGLTGIERGTARYVRILEDVPRKGVREGGVILTSGTEIFTVKRIFGTVPIEADGSAHFVVPADRNVYFEVLDEDGREIQRMRSVVCLKPGERRGCIGCHESRKQAPPVRSAGAFYRGPSRPAPPPWGTQVFSYLRDVQPLVSAKCARCHTHDRMANRVILTDDLTDRFTIAYEELVPYLAVANANRWDHPDDVYARFPLTYGSKVSRLTEILAAGHYDVELTDEDRERLDTWIDANAAYYDRYEHYYGPKRSIFVGPVRGAMNEVYGRRCAKCHGGGDGSHGTWWLSLNRRDVANSRLLAAPLARTAGGWGRCDETVFADASDPDYEKLLAALTTLRDTLAERPRADLLSIRGTEAERQVVAIPDPPPRKSTPSDLPEGDWVYLSDLAWESARSGWTPNKDGLPRLDRDVQEQPLRLGLRRHAKGIGTHAPSEIVYPLDGKYARFFAQVGGAEAGGTVVFQVYGDDKLLAETGLMRGIEAVETIDVSTEGVRRLRLVVTDAGDNYFSDMANWASARLLRTTQGDRER